MDGRGQFSQITPSEVLDLAFDFQGDVSTLYPETIVSATVEMTVKEVTRGATKDATPGSRLVSAQATIGPNDDGTADMAAIVRVGPGCVDGNLYLLKCLAVTSRGQKLEISVELPCVEAR
jgi:hypothetical protein